VLEAKQALQHRGYIVMNTEEELFYPTLTVGQTMDFATRLNIPNTLPKNAESRESYRQGFKDFLMDSMSIGHTETTKVGDAFVRGVSGGERKRVSIIETLCTGGSVMCWDNSTRGLDASTALEYTRALRTMTDVMGIATVVTLYQAGNGIYNLFDKVLVLDEGKQVYYGPLEQARPFMEAQGFVCSDGANVADFLTGVTVPSERQIKPGFESRFPRNNLDLHQAYSQSPIKTAADRELDYPNTDEAKANTKAFTEAVAVDKSSKLSKNSPMTVSFLDQVKACVTRQYQIIWGDKSTFFIKQGTTFAQALISGSLFYNAPTNTAGLFIKGGALFLALLFNALIAMSEVTDSYAGRPILAKHKNFVSKTLILKTRLDFSLPFAFSLGILQPSRLLSSTSGRRCPDFILSGYHLHRHTVLDDCFESHSCRLLHMLVHRVACNFRYDSLLPHDWRRFPQLRRCV
jgi:ABC-type multidrug transport system ATPase subunit